MLDIEANIGENPKFGRRLIVDIIDARAATTPDKEWLSVPKTSNPKDGWRVLTYSQAANAINVVAHKITDASGAPDPPNSFPTVAYIGPNDARYFAFALGAVKAGYQAMFISPRNSQEGQLNLFELTNCHLICFDTAFSAIVQPWLQERDMRAIVAAPLEDCFPTGNVKPFPYSKTFEEAEWDPLLVLHTSGTTGFPKPVVARQGMMAIADKFHDKDLMEWKGHMFSMAGMAKKSKRLFLPSKLLCLVLSLLMRECLANRFRNQCQFTTLRPCTSPYFLSTTGT